MTEEFNWFMYIVYGLFSWWMAWDWVKMMNGKSFWPMKKTTTKTLMPTASTTNAELRTMLKELRLQRNVSAFCLFFILWWSMMVGVLDATSYLMRCEWREGLYGMRFFIAILVLMSVTTLVMRRKIFKKKGVEEEE